MAGSTVAEELEMRPIAVRMRRGRALSVVFVTVLLATGAMTPPAYAAPGDMDPSFGDGGWATIDIGLCCAGPEMARTPRGEIILAGTTWGPRRDPPSVRDWDFALARFTRDGKLDPSFGDGGVVLTDYGDRAADRGETDDTLRAMDVLPNGTIVAAGEVRDRSGERDFALARYRRDGRLDPSFGDGGKVRLDLGNSPDRILALALYPDGRILAGGATAEPGSIFPFVPVLARFNPDGSLDSSFGDGGIVRMRLASQTAEFTAVDIQRDGKILAVSQGSVLRFNSDGSLDTTFGDGGIVDVFSPGDIFAIAVQSRGKIILGGGRVPLGMDFRLVRLNPDGSVDTSFGDGGEVITDFDGQNELVTDLALQPNGTIVAVGHSWAGEGPPDGNWGHDFAVARYDRDGRLDPRFGEGGKVLTEFGPQSRVAASAVVVEPRGDITIAGNTFGPWSVGRLQR